MLGIRYCLTCVCYSFYYLSLISYILLFLFILPSLPRLTFTYQTIIFLVSCLFMMFGFNLTSISPLINQIFD
jgi:hypothetical protein